VWLALAKEVATPVRDTPREWCRITFRQTTVLIFKSASRTYIGLESGSGTELWQLTR